MNRPLLPSEMPKTDPLQEWRRGILAKALARTSTSNIGAIVQRLWPDQPALQAKLIERAVTSPATLASPLAGHAGGAFLRSLRPVSAAAQLFDAANNVAMTGAATVTLPAPATNFPVPVFVSEGSPIPAIQGGIAQSTVGPPKKLATMTALTGELATQSAEAAEGVIRFALDEATSRALDAAVFSNAPASDQRPAGLLNGVAPIAATAGGGLLALAKDAENLIGAIVDAGGGVDVAFYMNPRQALAVSIFAPGFAYPVVPAAVLPAGTIVAVERRAIVSGFPALPDVDVSKDAAVHFENQTPGQIASNGALPSGASIRSAFQSDLLVMRVVLPCAWTTMISGAVQIVTGATW